MRTLIKNNQSGFSLVELMVVVAIIGILATVAIPSVGKYMAKARQSEAKTSLASLYSAEKAFFVEYNSYAAHFTVIGHAPEGQLRYNYGFDAVTLPGAYTDMNYNGAPASAAISAVTACTAANAAAQLFTCTLLKEGRVGAAAAGAGLAMTAGAAGATTATANITYGANPSFRALARAILVGNTRIDSWTMDNLKVLRNPENGI